MGMAHAGYDVCARCYYDHVKPAQRAEREAVKARKALKRQHTPTLSGTGVLGGNGEQPGGTQAWIALEPKSPSPPRGNSLIRDAILDQEIEKLIEGKTEEEALEAVTSELVRLDVGRDEYSLFTALQTLKEPVQEEHTSDVPEPKPVNIPPHQLNDGQRKDILEAYKANLTVKDICETWNIATTTLYDIVRKAGVPLRSDVARPRPAPVLVPPPRRRTPPPPRRIPPPPPDESPLRYYRLKARLNQDELADLADVARTTIVRLEGDPTAAPNFETTRRLAAVLKVAPSKLDAPWVKEPEMPQSTEPVSAPAVELAPSNGVVSRLPEWTVTYTVTRTVTETVTVAAKDFNAAAHAASGEANVGDDGVVDVISVARKQP